jgi:hypothetical protein
MSDGREESEVENNPPMAAQHRAVFRVTSDEDGKPGNELLIAEAESDMPNEVHKLWQRL